MHQVHQMHLRMNPFQKQARIPTQTLMVTLEAQVQVQVQVQKPHEESGILQLGE